LQSQVWFSSIIDPANPQRVDYDKGKDADTEAALTAKVQQATSGGNIGDELEKLASLDERGVFLPTPSLPRLKKDCCARSVQKYGMAMVASPGNNRAI